MAYRSRVLTSLAFLATIACGAADDNADNPLDESPPSPSEQGPTSELGDDRGGGELVSAGGQSGGEGAAPYHCWCERLGDRVVVRATLVEANDDEVELAILEVLGRHVIEPEAFVGQTLRAAYSEECEATRFGEVGTEVLAFYRPAVLGRTETDPCGESFAECSAACTALTPPTDDAPARCITGCSAAADLDCGPLDIDLAGADPSTWVVVPLSDPRVQNLADPHELGMSVDDLQGEGTCSAAVGGE